MMNDFKTLAFVSSLIGVLLLSACAKSPKTVAGPRLVAALGKYPKLDYQIINDGDDLVNAGIMSCSTADNWSTDNPSVHVGYSGDCAKNGCIPHVIGKKESLRGSLHIEYLEKTKVNGYFRLHFKGCKGIYTSEIYTNQVDELWSEPIQMVAK